MSEILQEFIPRRPDGWSLAPIGDVLTEVDRPIRMRDSTEYKLASIRRRNGGMFHRETLPGRKILTKTLRDVVPGSFVLARMQVVHGACALVPDEFAGYTISKSYSSFLGTTDCDIGFFAHLSKQPLMYRYFMDASQGVVIEKMTFDQDRWLSFPIYLPPFDEQRRIAEILDTIDEAIQATERLIAKLGSVRTGTLEAGIASSTIARGATSRPLYDIVDAPVCYGIVQPGPSVPFGVPMVAIRDLNNTFKDLHLVTQRLDSQYARSRIRGGDVLVSVKGTIGRTTVVPAWFVGNISRDVARLRPSSAVMPEFLEAFLRSDSGQRSLSTQVVGTTRAEVSIGILAQIAIPDVPVAEQRRVADLDVAMARRIEAEAAYGKALLQIRMGLAADLLLGRVRTVAQ